IEAYARAAAIEPDVASHRRLLGTAHLMAGDHQRASAEFETALRLDPRDVRSWAQRALCFAETADREQSDAAFDDAIRRFGPVHSLIEMRLVVLRRHGRRAEALALLDSLIEAQPNDAWLHHQAARTLGGKDGRRASEHFRLALDLAPKDPDILVDFADHLNRTRGAEEPDNIAAASRLAKQRVDLGGGLTQHAKELRDILGRVADYEAVAKLGSCEDLGPHFAALGKETGLRGLMNEARTPAQRRQLLAFHPPSARRLDP